MGRGLDIRPSKQLLRAAERQRALDETMDRWAAWLPEREGQYDNRKIYAFHEAFSVEHGSEAFRHHVVRRLVEVAASIARNRLEGFGYVRVAALIQWPNLGDSEICVFFDPEYAQHFIPELYRANANPILSGVNGDGKDLLALANVELPPGFSAGGCWTSNPWSDDGVLDHQNWSIMEIETSKGAMP